MVILVIWLTAISDCNLDQFFFAKLDYGISVLGFASIRDYLEMILSWHQLKARRMKSGLLAFFVKGLDGQAIEGFVGDDFDVSDIKIG